MSVLLKFILRLTAVAILLGMALIGCFQAFQLVDAPSNTKFLTGIGFIGLIVIVVLFLLDKLLYCPVEKAEKYIQKEKERNGNS